VRRIPTLNSGQREGPPLTLALGRPSSMDGPGPLSEPAPRGKSALDALRFYGGATITLPCSFTTAAGTRNWR
jgi:hypothetical protein